MRQQEEQIKQKIVDAHRRGVCDGEGRTYPPRIYGVGRLPTGLVPFGEQKIRNWPRDESGQLIGDD
jgi:hypothetical protein